VNACVCSDLKKKGVVATATPFANAFMEAVCVLASVVTTEKRNRGAIEDSRDFAQAQRLLSPFMDGSQHVL
jgi:hypothetical protein